MISEGIKKGEEGRGEGEGENGEGRRRGEGEGGGEGGGSRCRNQILNMASNFPGGNNLAQFVSPLDIHIFKVGGGAGGQLYV